MENYESLWATMSHYESLWATISHYDLWVTMSHQWVTMSHYESLWVTSLVSMQQLLHIVRLLGLWYSSHIRWLLPFVFLEILWPLVCRSRIVKIKLCCCPSRFRLDTSLCVQKGWSCWNFHWILRVDVGWIWLILAFLCVRYILLCNCMGFGTRRG